MNVVFEYDVDDKASSKLQGITQKLQNVRREMAQIKSGMNLLKNAGGAVAGGIGGFIGSGGGTSGPAEVKAPISSVKNDAFEAFASVATLLGAVNIGGAVAGKVASKLGGGLMGRIGGQVAGGLIGLGIGGVSEGAIDALRPLVSSAKIENPSAITTKQTYNIKKATKDMLDTYIHPSYSQHFMYKGAYESRRQEIEMQITLESQKRTKEMTDSLWMMYRE